MRSLGESPEQHGELADGPEVRLRIEGYYMRFVVWLVHVRRVQVETARKYFGEALSAHVTYYGPPVPARQLGSVIASTSYEDFGAIFDHEEFVRT